MLAYHGSWRPLIIECGARDTGDRSSSSAESFHSLEGFRHRDCANALSHEEIDHVGEQVGDQDGKDIADRSDPCQEDHIVDENPAHHGAVEEHAERKTDEAGSE